MLKDLNLLNDHQMIVIWRHAKHHAMFYIQRYLACVPILPVNRTATTIPVDCGDSALLCRTSHSPHCTATVCFGDDTYNLCGTTLYG